MSDVDDRLVDRALRAIQRSRFPWRTTGALARELRSERSDLYRALCREAARKGRRIRYHPLPSVHTLDVLWGDVADVGEVDDLPSLERTDEPDEPAAMVDGPLVFVSHNHRDAAMAVEIERLLLDSGVAPWLFTTGIEHRAVIIDAVRQALERCQGFVVLVSSNSLGSLWVRKEFGLGLEQLGEAVDRALAVFDATDPELLGHFGLSDSRSTSDGFDDYCRRATADLDVDPGEWLRNAHELKASLDGFTDVGGNVAAHPASPERYVVGTTTIEAWALSLRRL